MKKIILIIAWALSTNAYSQEKEGKDTEKNVIMAVDTLSAVKKFETYKSQYIGKPFSVLLADLGAIQPRLVMPGSGQALNDLSLSPLTYFIFAGRSDMYSYDVPIMRITWKDPLSWDEVVKYRLKNDAKFTTEEKNYYSSKIVADIEVYRRMDLK